MIRKKKKKRDFVYSNCSPLTIDSLDWNETREITIL